MDKNEMIREITKGLRLTAEQRPNGVVHIGLVLNGTVLDTVTITGTKIPKAKVVV